MKTIIGACCALIGSMHIHMKRVKSRFTMTISTIAFVLTVFAALQASLAYPIVAELAAGGERCYTLFLPADDDAHLVLLPLPGDVSVDLESWFVLQVAEMTRPESSGYLKEIHVPREISDQTDKYSRGSIQVVVSKENGATPLHGSLDDFEQKIYRDIAKNIGGDSDEENAFDVCFRGIRGKGSRIIYDLVELNDFEDKLQHKHMLKKEHLTPLETVFEQSIVSAKKVLEEMEVFQRHETRMKHTADSTNARIRLFSYFSVTVLVAVTYFQIKYLKGYFKKKKIL